MFVYRVLKQPHSHIIFVIIDHVFKLPVPSELQILLLLIAIAFSEAIKSLVLHTTYLMHVDSDKE